MSQGRLDLCRESLARQLLLTQWGPTSIASREREQMPVFSRLRRYGSRKLRVEQVASNRNGQKGAGRIEPEDVSPIG